MYHSLFHLKWLSHLEWCERTKPRNLSRQQKNWNNVFCCCVRGRVENKRNAFLQYWAGCEAIRKLKDASSYLISTVFWLREHLIPLDDSSWDATNKDYTTQTLAPRTRPKPNVSENTSIKIKSTMVEFVHLPVDELKAVDLKWRDEEILTHLNVLKKLDIKQKRLGSKGARYIRPKGYTFR